MNVDDLRAFEDVVRRHYPELRIEFKDSSILQRLIGFLVYPFNPQYMTRYTSTFAPSVYFPSRESYEANPKSSITVLAHELVHLLDTQRQPFWFRVSYLFPQVLAPLAFGVYLWFSKAQGWPLGALVGSFLVAALISRLSLAAFFVVAILGLAGSGVGAVYASGWSSIAFFVGLGLLAPWPSPGRVLWEKRGYAMSIAIYRWTLGSVPQILREAVLRSFVGPFYYYMSWRRAEVSSWIDQTVTDAASGELAKEEPYKAVYEFLRSRNAVR